MVWDSEMKFVSCCGELPDSFQIEFDPKVYAKIDILMEEKDNIEWLAFLLGEINWSYCYATVNDLYIPDSQTVSIGDVDDIECDDSIRSQLIGVIHSHHRMGCFFSRDDWNYLNNNHHISIVVSNQSGENEFKGVVRHKTACGSYSHIDADIRLKCVLEVDEINSFCQDINTKIKSGMGEFAPNCNINDIYDDVYSGYLKNRNINNLPVYCTEYDIYDDV